jgi:hypothetical protein
VGGNSSTITGPGVGGMSNGDSGSGIGVASTGGIGSGGGMVTRRGGRGGGGANLGGGVNVGGGVASGPAWRTRVGASFGSSSSIGMIRLGVLRLGGARRCGSAFGLLGGSGGLTMSFPLMTYKVDASTTPIDAASLPSSSFAGIFCVEGSPDAAGLSSVSHFCGSLPRMLPQLRRRVEQTVAVRDLPERVRERHRILIAIVGIGRERRGEHDVQRRRQALALLRRRHDRLGVDDVGRGAEISDEQPFGRQRLVETDRHRIEIGPVIDRLAAGLLGRHVADFSTHAVEGRRVGGGLGDPEVGELHLTLHGTEDVRG